MDYITPCDRHQVTFGSLDEMVAPENPVRFLDAFAEKLDLARLGFQVKETAPEGRGHRMIRSCSLKFISMAIRMVSGPRDGWKRNVNAIWRCSGFAAGWYPIIIPSPTSGR